MLAKVHVPASVLAPHVLGSYEHVREQVGAALVEQAPRLVGGGRLAVVATHPEHVVVLSEATGMYRIPYVISPQDEVVFGTIEPLRDETIDKSNVGTYVQAQAEGLVGKLLQGESIVEGMFALLPLVGPENRAATGARGVSDAQAIWRHLLVKQVGSGASLGEAKYASRLEALDATHRPEITESAQARVADLQRLLVDLRERYGRVCERELHEGPRHPLGVLTISETRTMLEGAVSELQVIALRGADLLGATPATGITDLASYHDSVATQLPVYRTLLVSVDAMLC